MRLRVAARCLIICDGKLLVQVSRRGDFYRLPGGHVAPYEPALEALRRELREELGVEPEVGDLLFVVDEFYRRRGRLYRELCLVFECRIEGDPEPREEHVTVKWLDVKDVAAASFRPKALKQLILDYISGKKLSYAVAVED